MDILRSLIDEAELAQEADKACILELSHKFTFQPVDSAAENTVSITNCVFPGIRTHFCASSSSVRRRLPIMSKSCPMFYTCMAISHKHIISKNHAPCAAQSSI